MKLDVCPIREALNQVLLLFHNTFQPDNEGMISEESTGGFFIWDILRHLGKPLLNPKHSEYMITEVHPSPVFFLKDITLLNGASHGV